MSNKQKNYKYSNEFCLNIADLLLEGVTPHEISSCFNLSRRSLYWIIHSRISRINIDIYYNVLKSIDFNPKTYSDKFCVEVIRNAVKKGLNDYQIKSLYNIKVDRLESIINRVKYIDKDLYIKFKRINKMPIKIISDINFDSNNEYMFENDEYYIFIKNKTVLNSGYYLNKFRNYEIDLYDIPLRYINYEIYVEALSRGYNISKDLVSISRDSINKDLDTK